MVEEEGMNDLRVRAGFGWRTSKNENENEQRMWEWIVNFPFPSCRLHNIQKQIHIRECGMYSLLPAMHCLLTLTKYN